MAGTGERREGVTFQEFLPLITGTGGAFAALLAGIWLFATGKVIPAKVHKWIVGDKDQQITTLTEALTLERKRADAAVSAGAATLELFKALHNQAGP